MRTKYHKKTNETNINLYSKLNNETVNNKDAKLHCVHVTHACPASRAALQTVFELFIRLVGEHTFICLFVPSTPVRYSVAPPFYWYHLNLRPFTVWSPLTPYPMRTRWLHIQNQENNFGHLLSGGESVSFHGVRMRHNTVTPLCKAY